MKNFLSVWLILPLLLILACSDTSVDPGDSQGIRSGDNFTFHKNSALAEMTEQNRSSDISDPFEIDNVSFEEMDGQKLMHIEVTQMEGCSETYPEKFEIIWDGIMLMIYPPQIGLYLKFDASGCSNLEENVKDTITISLIDTLESENLVKNAVITVLNASKSSTDNDQILNR